MATADTHLHQQSDGWEFCADCHMDWPCSGAYDERAAEITRLNAEVARLRTGLEKVQERHRLATWAPHDETGATDFAKHWHDGFVTAMATVSLMAAEILDPGDYAAHEAAMAGTDREWFERTGCCGHCGNDARYCTCTADDPCGCGPHELCDDPLPCSWCGGTGEKRRPKAEA